ncbi:HepT-like ribonuclease domain-containing protein [Brachybacterium timonense]|uniref:HepT-like ribonuclease domain-containing protein n=1 Tax=Brachybacterium timonense TaxID=2050896 RepID=UPI00110F66BC|nr:HepT-like ribonuclease domain-containing protein [Brachybacterium timonense]
MLEALDHVQLAAQHASSARCDQIVVDAICMRLSAGIETLSRLDEDARSRLFGPDWTVMWGMRNRIAHGYILVDTDLVLMTAKEDLPPLIRTLRERIQEL